MGPSVHQDFRDPFPGEFIKRVTVKVQRQKPSRKGSQSSTPVSGAPTTIDSTERASKAQNRCWETYMRCCITGETNYEGDDRPSMKPPDIQCAHIFNHAYRDDWVRGDWEYCCTDHGPPGDQIGLSHSYVGFHHICCLSNMIPLRNDVHALFDAHRIGIDTNDQNKVISFGKGRMKLGDFHLNLDGIPQDLRPLEALLRFHLSQGVSIHCLPPTSNYLDVDVTRFVQEFGAKGMESGAGKSAFESYLAEALSTSTSPG